MTRWCFRHHLVVLLLWAVALGGTVLAGRLAGGAYAKDFKPPASESVRAADLMRTAFPARSGDTDVVVWRVDGPGTVRDAAVRDRMRAVLDRIAALPDVGQALSPYRADGAGQTSADGRTAYAQITYTRPTGDLAADRIERVVDTARSAATSGLTVEVGGPAAGGVDQPPPHLAEFAGLAVAAVVLYLAFGSFPAMLLPLVTALFGVGLGLAGIELLGHAMTMPSAALLLSTLIGLGVGIDYALFVVSRYRGGLREGLPPEPAAIDAARTSGRSVLFAGGIVCVSLLGMFAMGLDFLNGVAVATSLTVLLSVAAALTLLPALFGLLGTRVLSRRERRLPPAASSSGVPTTPRPGRAARWADVVQRRPRTFAVVASALVAVLSLPAFSLRLGVGDQGTLPESNTARRAYDMLADAFGPGFNGPLQMVVRPRDGGAEVPPAVLERLVGDVRATRGVAKATVMPLPGQARGGMSAGGAAPRMAVVQVIPATSPQDAGTGALIDRLRTGPAARDGSLEVLVGGATAVDKDLASTLAARLPLFLAVIVALGSVLLLAAFRSLAVPLLAAVLNVAATGTALGITVALFQWGWGTGVLGIGKPVPVTSFLPVLMIAMLFGLAMDYQVFLTGRMREEWLRTRDARRAVHAGLVHGGGVIVSAAVIMIAVFGAFVMSGDREGMLVGAGLAGAVAVEAFVLRTMLVPAVMTLLGAAAWWLPARAARERT
ncbi:MMPL family transporter [Actinomadura harenae]|uniref:MMPL family transporter n=1 Tax=Actinomadura harenae TaxID=2483351 RepID=A0A3M2LZH4_9ACTN|nr:MMPL family transporter [Actinomadura harenae]RMI42542.1 MMPL family transporter [Actinomadura harenae]